MTGDDAALQAKALRESAAALLQQASQSTDLSLSDVLTRKALAQIEQARRLLDTTEAPPFRPARRLH